MIVSDLFSGILINESILYYCAKRFYNDKIDIGLGVCCN